jgi:peptidoglycan/LPS O-acetylase OafA/YrhL
LNQASAESTFRSAVFTFNGGAKQGARRRIGSLDGNFPLPGRDIVFVDAYFRKAFRLVTAFPGPTLADRLAAAANRPAGFDYLRFLLASAVIVTHAFMLTLVDVNPARPLIAMILPMFFALSGFLVCGSLVRCKTLVDFLALRVLRLLPALAVETTLSAVVIGVIFTVLPLDAYFTDPMFRGYFTSIIGIVKYKLPGVFLTNPWPELVNGQLWTLKFELYSYMLLAMAVLLGLVRPKIRFGIFVAVSMPLFFVLGGLVFVKTPTLAVHGPVLVACFAAGVAAFLYRERIVWSGRLFAVALVASLACLSVPLGDYAVAVPVTYATIYLGLLDPHRISLVRTGDYSYGLFLYGYPIQQATIAAMGEPGRHWSINLAVAYPIALAVAGFSWWCVERPFLKLKPLLHRARSWGASRPPLAARASGGPQSTERAAGSSSPGLL